MILLPGVGGPWYSQGYGFILNVLANVEGPIMSLATAPPPAQAGQRLLWINGVTWVVLLVVLGYGVFTSPMPSPPLADRSTGGGFFRAPGPVAPGDTTPNPADQPPPPDSVSTGLRVIGMAGAPRTTPNPAKDAASKTENVKSTAPAKTEPPKAEEPKLRLGVFGAARPPKDQ
jgi:hypothetical protein